MIVKILVTGASGTVGRRLVDALLADGHTVRALTRTPAAAALPGAVEVVVGDLSAPSCLDGALDGVDAAHLFALGTDDVADPQGHVDDLVARVRRAGVRRLTVLDGTGTVPLGPAVLAVGGTVIAPVEFMANARWWADAIRGEGVVREASPDAPSTVVHEADIAAVTAAVLTGDGAHAGTTVTVTGPEALTLRERVTVLAEVSGRTLRVEEPTPEELLAQWRAWGLAEDVIAQFLAWSDEPPEVASTPLDTVERLTGRPGRTFRTWARENAAAFA